VKGECNVRNTVFISKQCNGNVTQKFTLHKLFKLQNSDEMYYGTTNVYVWNNISKTTPALTGLTFAQLQHAFKFQHMVYEKYGYYLKRES